MYLLRRELIDTAGYNPDADNEDAVDAEGVRNRLFASLIVMFTAIDLLAKFQFGDKNGVGDRFTGFLTSATGAGMKQDNAELLYAVRNSLVHAFGVPDSDILARLGLRGVELHRRIEAKDGLVVVQRKTWHPNVEIAVLYIDGVFRVLKASIQNYHEALLVETATDLRSQFEEMFDKYGTINMA